MPSDLHVYRSNAASGSDGELVRVRAGDTLAVAVEDRAYSIGYRQGSALVAEAERAAVRERARAAAAESAFPDFTPRIRPSLKVAPASCQAPGCDNPLPPGTRADRCWCSKRCGENVRQRRYRASLAERGLWPPSKRRAS